MENDYEDRECQGDAELSDCHCRTQWLRRGGVGRRNRSRGSGCNGSRIKSASVYAPQPISTITSETITQSGQVDITEVLNDNPALSSVSSSNSIDATAANIGDVGAIGGASPNLRGLGIERTLTVVNGRRHVVGLEGTSAVDVGSIPRALIDRVEVLTVVRL